MNKQDLENLVMDTYLLDLVAQRPEMRQLKNVDEIQSFIKKHFTSEQLLAAYMRASEAVLGGLEKSLR